MSLFQNILEKPRDSFLLSGFLLDHGRRHVVRVEGLVRVAKGSHFRIGRRRREGVGIGGHCMWHGGITRVVGAGGSWGHLLVRRWWRWGVVRCREAWVAEVGVWGVASEGRVARVHVGIPWVVDCALLLLQLVLLPPLLPHRQWGGCGVSFWVEGRVVRHLKTKNKN